MKETLIALLLVVTVCSCLEEPDCSRTTGTVLRIAFKKKSNGSNDTLKLRQIIAIGTDSIFYAPATVTNRLSVDVTINPYEDQTTYIFQILNEEDKMLKVGYRRSTRFISPDCGVETFYKNIEVLESDFDSTRVVIAELNEKRAENVQIFR